MQKTSFAAKHIDASIPTLLSIPSCFHPHDLQVPYSFGLLHLLRRHNQLPPHRLLLGPILGGEAHAGDEARHDEERAKRGTSGGGFVGG